MKKNILIIIMLLGVSYNKALAQDTLSVAPQQIAQSLLEKLDHEVSLTTKQRTEVYTLLLERSEKFARIRENNKAKKLSNVSFQEVNQQALGKLQQALTPEQYEKLKALRQEARRQKTAYREEDIYKSLQDIELDF